MSVRFFKILSAVVLAHGVVLSLIWVGFSAPLPRPPVTFTYEGAFPAQDLDSEAEDEWQKTGSSDQFALEQFEASYFDHWIKLRDPRYKHSGLAP